MGGAQLTLEKVKDETKGDKKHKMEWKYSLWTKVMDSDSTGQHLVDFKTAYLGFWYSNFVVQKITIRNKKFAEIYADLGGIWAASVALLAYVFVKSGYIDSTTK